MKENSGMGIYSGEYTSQFATCLWNLLTELLLTCCFSSSPPGWHPAAADSGRPQGSLWLLWTLQPWLWNPQPPRHPPGSGTWGRGQYLEGGEGRLGEDGFRSRDWLRGVIVWREGRRRRELGERRGKSGGFWRKLDWGEGGWNSCSVERREGKREGENMGAGVWDLIRMITGIWKEAFRLGCY